MPTRRALLGAALAATGPFAVAPVSPARAADPQAVAVIAGLNQALLAAMQAGPGVPFPQRYAALQPAVDRAFDFQTIVANVVGPRWNSFAPPQQAQLLATFRAFTVASYASNFDSFGGERLEVLPASRNVGADQVVETQITPANGQSRRLDYVMRRGPGGWQAVDVLLDGTISQTAVQRSDFRSLLRSGGAEALIASLQRKVYDLSGGTLRS